MKTLFPLLLLSLLLPLALAQASSETITLETASGSLHGTLELPADSGPFPVALIHPGSGPTDRDGNSAGLAGSNDSLKRLAEGLRELGVASLRIDKRGVGESAPALSGEADGRFDHYVDDAVAWLELLADDERFDRLVAIGHSEGALITLLAALRHGADGYISVAGAGENAADILTRQLSAQLPEPLLAETVSVIETLRAGDTVAELPANVAAVPGLAGLFRASVQPYMVSWFAYHPATEIARLAAPTLIVQGSTDLQVGVADAEALAAARPGAQLVIVEGMNHVLKEAPLELAANQATYLDPTLPLAAGLIDPIISFILGLEVP